MLVGGFDLIMESFWVILDFCGSYGVVVARFGLLFSKYV